MEISPLDHLIRTVAGCTDAPLTEEQDNGPLEHLCKTACVNTLTKPRSYAKLHYYRNRYKTIPYKVRRSTMVFLFNTFLEYTVFPDFPLYKEGLYYGTLPALAQKDRDFSLVVFDFVERDCKAEERATIWAPACGVMSGMFKHLTGNDMGHVRVVLAKRRTSFVMPCFPMYYDMALHIVEKYGSIRRQGTWCEGCPKGCGIFYEQKA